jgi:CRISPR-associated protein Csx17
MNAISLPGCAPIPLAHYLKALGILRLVAQQADPEAAGCWQRDVFILRSRLDRDNLLDFFLHRYRPTPILAPWNGGSGFYYQEEKLKEKDPNTGKRLKTGKRTQPTEATRVVEFLESTTDPRFEAYREAIRQTRILLSERGLRAAPSGVGKDELLVELRSRWPDAVVQWLDCVLVLSSGGSLARSKTGLLPNYTVLLGSGANDGNADFSSNFMQRLKTILLDAQSLTSGRSQRWLEAALFGVNFPGTLIKALAGQYSPGTAGGPNTSTGFTGDYSINPWDFVLLIEGSLLFAAAAVKRLSSSTAAGIAYPFAVRSVGAGFASACGKDEVAGKATTEELWLPLWPRPTKLAELQTIFSEGRAQVGQAAARTGVDFARAICASGTDRGFSEFIRYGFLVRRGDSTSATPLGRFAVRRNARADLLSEADRWLDNLRRIAKQPRRESESGDRNKPPPSVTHALREVEERVLDLCREGSPARLQAVLVALGQAEKALARSLGWTTGRNDTPPRPKINPLHGLSARWLREADDGSVEFRLAASLASITGRFKDPEGRPVWLPLRCHLEPVRAQGGTARDWFAWDDPPSNDVLWHEGEFVAFLNAVFARRLLRTSQAGLSELPDRGLSAALSDVVAFIEGRTDDARLADLLWGLCLLDWDTAVRSADFQSAVSRISNLPTPVFSGAQPTGSQRYGRLETCATPSAVPAALFTLLRLAFPRAAERRGPASDFPKVPLVPAIHRLAAAGNGLEASRLAARRLRASELPPALEAVDVRGDAVRRMAAALLFPLSPRDFARLAELILKPETENA